VTILETVTQVGIVAPKRPFGRDATDDDTITWGEAIEWSATIAGALQGEGVAPGDRVVMVASNCMAGWLAVLGIWRMGATWVAGAARGTPEQTADLIDLSAPRVVFFHSDQQDAVAAAVALSTSRPTLVCLDGPSTLGPSLADFASGARPASAVGGPVTDIAMLLSTGGTTGRPKAVPLSHRNLNTMVANLAHALPWSNQEQVHLVAAPMTHAAGLIHLAVMALGGSVVSLGAPAPDAILGAIERHHVTHLFLPPTLVYRLLDHPAARTTDTNSLRALIYGAAPMSESRLAEAIEAFGPVMTQVYGQIEAPVACTILRPDDHTRAPRSCGRPGLLTPLAVLDDNGSELGPDQRGEIAVTGDLVMSGYLNDPAATAAIRTGRWHRTGDLGYRDAEGLVYLVDRVKDIIITGGVNVFPNEVEQVVSRHPAVRDCAVVGVPHAEWGEAVTAVVELHEGVTVDAEEIRQFARERLDGASTPKQVVITEALPRSPVGKVLRRSVRDEYWTDQDRQV
jgi:acyl-CoA synthetase (AMP-forming)/AMP-acid ligase II